MIQEPILQLVRSANYCREQRDNSSNQESILFNWVDWHDAIETIWGVIDGYTYK